MRLLLKRNKRNNRLKEIQLNRMKLVFLLIRNKGLEEILFRVLKIQNRNIETEVKRIQEIIVNNYLQRIEMILLANIDLIDRKLKIN